MKKNGFTFTEKKTYDRYGRLTGISANGKDVKYLYNGRNQLAAQIVNNIPIEFTWTKYGQLESKTLGSKVKPIATLRYLYASDGMISGRIVDGKFQMYTYDRRGQLLQVADKDGVVSEKYQYDPAGNILSKTVDGKTTTYTYDKANQLVTSVCDGKTVTYAYDAAGRLIKEGDKTYVYGWLDKVLRVDEAGKTVASFDYHRDGQLAQVTRDGKSEEFLWDGLALIHRGGTDFINEPYITGGNPISSSKDGVMFNDMLGTTLNIGGRSVKMTAFGESTDAQAMYTGKPFIGELGYAFLFRNYRPDKGKWLTTDPLGYPDGWNQLAYVNNKVSGAIDLSGTNLYELYDKDAVKNRGHVLPFSTWQSADGKWHARGYDYGGKSSQNQKLTIFVATGNSEMDVVTGIITQCDPAGTTYDEMSRWNVSDANSLQADQKMERETTVSYHEKDHNCLTISKEARRAAGITVEEGNEWIPAYALAWRTNRNNYENILKQIQSGLRE